MAAHIHSRNTTEFSIIRLADKAGCNAGEENQEQRTLATAALLTATIQKAIKSGMGPRVIMGRMVTIICSAGFVTDLTSIRHTRLNLPLFVAAHNRGESI